MIYQHPLAYLLGVAADERDWQLSLEERFSFSPGSSVAVLDSLLAPLRERV